MKMLTVKLESGHESEPVSVTFTIQNKKSGAWEVVGSRTVLSGMPESERRVLLDVDQRLIIEGTNEPGVVYDPVQMMAVPATPEAPPVQEDKFRAKKQIDDRKEELLKNEKEREYLGKEAPKGPTPQSGPFQAAPGHQAPHKK